MAQPTVVYLVCEINDFGVPQYVVELKLNTLVMLCYWKKKYNFWIKVLYMPLDRFLLAVESRNLSQADKILISMSISWVVGIFEWLIWNSIIGSTKTANCILYGFAAYDLGLQICILFHNGGIKSSEGKKSFAPHYHQPSVRPKPGFGIGNRNTCPLSVSV